jgi:hypothetical protein
MTISELNHCEIQRSTESITIISIINVTAQSYSPPMEFRGHNFPEGFGQQGVNVRKRVFWKRPEGSISPRKEL